MFDKDDYPYSLRTPLRAKTLVALDSLGLGTIKELMEFGLKAKTTNRFLKEFMDDGLVVQRFSLFKLTNRGKEIVNDIRQFKTISKWISRQVVESITIEKPRIVKISTLREKSI